MAVNGKIKKTSEIHGKSRRLYLLDLAWTNARRTSVNILFSFFSPSMEVNDGKEKIRTGNIPMYFATKGSYIGIFDVVRTD
jgi:hypothetical protein